jgi:hypothetical protein
MSLTVLHSANMRNTIARTSVAPSRVGLVVFLMLALLQAVGASSAADRKSPCADSAHRAYDFFLGSWIARHADGTIIGTAAVTPVLGGCALRVDWTGSNFTGYSTDAYVADEHRWQKAWFDTKGRTEIVNGKAVHGSIVFEGTGREHQREEWRPVSARVVHQMYDVTEDGGKTWRRAFLLVYSKVTP